ncbi:hypothetical protein [Streptomyces sp. NPDC001404]|uniref:hypothetical protein n=1 Tax=Streptomyces sp. NPDC001404 TaxID=3364571 RepID=UPI0036856F1B
MSSDPDEGQPLSPEQAADIRARFDRGDGCRHCGGIHVRSCPRVRRLAFHPNGTLAEVEFWPDGRWSDASVIWPEELPGPAEEEPESGDDARRG